MTVEKIKGTKKTADTKKCIIKRKLKLENYKNCLELNHFENKINCIEKLKSTQIVLKKP